MKRRMITCLLILAALLSLIPGKAQAAQQEPLVLQQRTLNTNQQHDVIRYYYDGEARCVREEWEKDGLVIKYTYRDNGTLKNKQAYRKYLVENTVYDSWGNPLRTIAYSDDGKSWTITTYDNTYDSMDRMIQSIQQTKVDDGYACVQSNWNYGEGLPASYRKGDIFFFGAYEQDGDITNGPEPIAWQVLDEKDGGILVLSVEGLDSRTFHGKSGAVNWDNCDLRNWLYYDFTEKAFTEEESYLRKPTFTGETYDFVFLLSEEEVKTYLPAATQRLCRPTAYARSRNANVDPASGNSWWILRSSGTTGTKVTAVTADGRIETGKATTTQSGGVIRPAMWLDMQSMTQTVLRSYGTTAYTLKQGVRAIEKKERFVYDQYGGLTQHYIEETGGETKSYDYTNTYHLNQLIQAQRKCTNYTADNGEDGITDIYYSYDSKGRLIRELHTYSGGDGFKDYTWVYDSWGNVLTYSDQYRSIETNVYGPLSKALWTEGK